MGHLLEPEHADCRSKRQQILDAAYIVFSRNGYHRATVDEIIALADTGKGTVYNYFANKEQLFYTLIKERHAPFEKNMTQIVMSGEPPFAKLQSMIGVMLDFYMANADLWRIMMHEFKGFGTVGSGGLPPEQREKYRTQFLLVLEQLEKVLQEGCHQGLFREFDVRQCARSLFSVIVTNIFSRPADDDIQKAAKAIADIFFFGIARDRNSFEIQRE